MSSPCDAHRPQDRRGSSSMAAPLLRVKSKRLAAAGVERDPRVEASRRPAAARGRPRARRGNVVWCTGFRYDFTWIDLPVIADAASRSTSAASSPRRRACTSSGSRSSTGCASDVLPGVGRDAAHVGKHIASVRASRAHPCEGDAAIALDPIAVQKRLRGCTCRRTSRGRPARRATTALASCS